jgi:hypothetical protein
MTYYVGQLNVITAVLSECHFQILGSPVWRDKKLTLPARLGNGLRRELKSFCSTRGTW